MLCCERNFTSLYMSMNMQNILHGNGVTCSETRPRDVHKFVMLKFAKKIFKCFVILFLFNRYALQCLENNLYRINQDLQLKLNSLALDEQCMKSRERLASKRPISSMERNMTLTGMSRQKSALLA